MRLPDNVVERIFALPLEKEQIKNALTQANVVYQGVKSSYDKLNKFKDDYNEHEKFCKKDVEAWQNSCYHLWESHRSSVDSADDYEQCIVCGKYI